MQALFRGKQDRGKVDELRAKKAMAEQEQHEQEVYVFKKLEKEKMYKILCQLY